MQYEKKIEKLKKCEIVGLSKDAANILTLKELKQESELEIEYFKNLKICVMSNEKYEDRKIFLEMMVGEKDPEIFENYEIREKEIKMEKEKRKKNKKKKTNTGLDEMRSNFSEDSDNSDNKSENEDGEDEDENIKVQEDFNFENDFNNKKNKNIKNGIDFEIDKNRREINKSFNVEEIHEMGFSEKKEKLELRREIKNKNPNYKNFQENQDPNSKKTAEKKLKKLNQENEELMDIIEALAEEKNILIDNIQKHSKSLNKSKLESSDQIQAELSILESKLHHKNSNLYNILKNKENEIEKLKSNLIKLKKRHKKFVIRDSLDWEIDNVDVESDARDCVEMTKMSVYSEDLTEGFQNSRVSDFGRTSLANQFRESNFGNFGNFGI